MTLEEEIRFWGKEQHAAVAKELALVCFGIKMGLEIARREHMPQPASLKTSKPT